VVSVIANIVVCVRRRTFPIMEPEDLPDNPTAAQRMRDNTARIRKGLPPPEPSANGVVVPPPGKMSSIAADIATMERDLQRREKSYADREAEYMEKIRELSSAIEDAKTRDQRIR